MILFKLSRSFFLCAVALAVTFSSTLALAAEERHDTAASNHDTVVGAAILDGEDSDKPRFKPERMWLPASSQHLRPYLQLAVDQALKDEDCAEILYARLNEYRTVYEEPTFSVLCKKDYKTTYNHVYQASDLDQYYDTKVAEREAVAENSAALNPNIEALRQTLQDPSISIVSGSITAALPEPISESLELQELQELRESPQEREPRARRDEDPNDLSLDLNLNY